MKYVLAISYLGTDFCGWQSQPQSASKLPSIQDCLEKALTTIADDEIKVIASGRTDAGVHAINQVVHFDSQKIRSINQWLMGANSNLPKSIQIQAIKKVSDDFHARYSAISRTYRYLILNQSEINPFLFNRSLHFKYQLDIKKMRKAADMMIGTYDFSAFRSSQCQAKNPIRTIYQVNIETMAHNLIAIEISANAFLHNMVRILVSVLLEIATGKKDMNWFIDIQKSKKRNSKIKTMSADGLYLKKVNYPKIFNLDNFEDDLITI